MSTDEFKRAAAAEAAALIEPDMTVGLGTGSTAAHFIDLLGARGRDGLVVSAIPTSEETRARALAAGLDVIEPDETTVIDVAVDGADEIDPAFNLIKGAGGALLREKIIAEAARQFIVIADETKRVSQLGARLIPVEIDRFAWALTVRRLRETLAGAGFANADIALRGDARSGYFATDGENFIVDCALSRIADPAGLDAALRALPGVIETGLFTGLVDLAILAGPQGVETISRPDL